MLSSLLKLIQVSKENGTRLVGQCEISHPVRSGNGLSITLSGEEEPLSPHDQDGLSGTVGRPSNVLFESSKKGEYEPLSSRITSKWFLCIIGNNTCS